MAARNGDRYRIDRRVRLASAPASVKSALVSTVWWPAVSLEPCGTGTTVWIRADISPAPLGRQIEIAALAAVLENQKQLLEKTNQTNAGEWQCP